MIRIEIDKYLMAVVMSDSGLFSTLTIRELASAKPMLGNPVTLMNTGGLSKMLTMIKRRMPLLLLHVANLILACFICISSVWIFGGLLWAEGESLTPDYFWPTLIALGLPLAAVTILSKRIGDSYRRECAAREPFMFVTDIKVLRNLRYEICLGAKEAAGSRSQVAPE